MLPHFALKEEATSEACFVEVCHGSHGQGTCLGLQMLSAYHVFPVKISTHHVLPVENACVLVSMHHLKQDSGLAFVTAAKPLLHLCSILADPR